jgi:hypothetical protein
MALQGDPRPRRLSPRSKLAPKRLPRLPAIRSARICVSIHVSEAKAKASGAKSRVAAGKYRVRASRAFSIPLHVPKTVRSISDLEFSSRA